MKVLVATAQTQGDAPGDYFWAVEGELVLAEPVIECANPRCGCERGFPGLASSRAATTAMVVDRPGLSRLDVASAIEASLGRQGWLRGLSSTQIANLIDEQIELIEFVTACLPAGTVVQRRAGVLQMRRDLDEAA